MTVGALDETGQEKQGSSTSGVKRQYMGCAGRVANGINTVLRHDAQVCIPRIARRDWRQISGSDG
jgi:SRSO17 transposase